MVMRITRIVETSIQVVSPLLTVGAAAAAASAAGAAASCARAGSRASRPSAAPPRAVMSRGRIFIGFELRKTWLKGWESKGIDIGLAGADADCLFERRDEDLAVADLPCAGCGRDRLDHLRDQLGGDRYLDLQLRQEAHGIFGAAIDFRMTLLPSISFDFSHGKPVHAKSGERVAHLLQLERLDDRHHDFHGS